ncbi:MAG: hypothetical protein Q8P92_05705 [Candidatus Daviesbacteria bacterium]|nr:hypothetical protein [Candidatus Daviesbacteria bacterium]
MNKREWLIAAVLTFITIISWVVFDIIHTQQEVEIPSQVQEVLEPLDPNFNTQVLKSLP